MTFMLPFLFSRLMANITNLSEDFFSAEPRLGLISLNVVLLKAITKPIEGDGTS